MASLSRIISRSFWTQGRQKVPKSIARILHAEQDPIKLVQTFKKSSEVTAFRSNGHSIYKNIVLRLVSAEKLSLVEEILEDQKKYADIKSEGFAVRIISLYGKAGMVENALKTFEQLPDLKCTRTIKSLNALLTAYIDAKKFNEVEPMFRELTKKFELKPNAITYNVVINAVCKNEEFNEGIALLDEMEKNGVGPSEISYKILLRGLYGKNELFLKAEEIFTRMEKKGLVSDSQCYNYKLIGIRLTGTMSEVVKFVEEMEKNEKVETDAHTYNQLLVGYCGEGNLEEAKKVFDDKSEKGLINWQSVNILVPYLCENGELNKALEMCRNGLLKVKGNVFKDPLQRVVDELVKDSRVEEAKKFVEDTLASHHVDLSLE